MVVHEAHFFNKANGTFYGQIQQHVGYVITYPIWCKSDLFSFSCEPLQFLGPPVFNIAITIKDTDLFVSNWSKVPAECHIVYFCPLTKQSRGKLIV